MATTITPQIVNEIVNVSAAPEPSALQKSGALISVGGTTLAANSWQYCGSATAVTALSSNAGNYAELANMATTYFAQGTTVGVYVLELGANTDVAAQVSALSTWIAANPGVFYAYLTPANWDGANQVSAVTVTDGGSGYTTAPAVTFEAAPTGGTTATGTATINTSGVVTGVTITNPGYYPGTSSVTVTFAAPTSGTTATGTVTLGNALNTLAGNNSSNTAKTYLFGTTSATTYSQYSANKALYMVAPAPTAPSTEFTAAAHMAQALGNSPSIANQLAPMSYRFLYGVTAWEQNSTNNPLINNLLSAYVNICLQGAEGGISDVGIWKGTVMSGTQFSNWYGIDYVKIQADQAVAAAIINGSNSQPPLLYDQSGINTLEGVAQTEGDDAVSYGCAQSVTVSAVAYQTYVTANPTDYEDGIYNGLSATVVAQNGFLTVTFTINVSQFSS